MLAARDLGSLLAEGGAVVAGGMAIFGGAFFLAALVMRDVYARDVDLLRWLEVGTGYGALFGFAALAYRALGVH